MLVPFATFLLVVLFGLDLKNQTPGSSHPLGTRPGDGTFSLSGLISPYSPPPLRWHSQWGDQTPYSSHPLRWHQTGRFPPKNWSWYPSVWTLGTKATNPKPLRYLGNGLVRSRPLFGARLSCMCVQPRVSCKRLDL